MRAPAELDSLTMHDTQGLFTTRRFWHMEHKNWAQAYLDCAICRFLSFLVAV